MEKVQPPKPLSCIVENGITRITFAFEDLREYLYNTDDQKFSVTAANGERVWISVFPLKSAVKLIVANKIVESADKSLA